MMLGLLSRLAVVALTSLSCAACVAAPFGAVASRFQYKVPFDIGQTQQANGDRIEITELWGTRPQIEVGGDYMVVGRYFLESFDEARVCFYLTADNWDNSGPDMDLQSTTVKKGAGAFALMHSMTGPGFLHVSMSGQGAAESVRVANVYFGKGDNLLREVGATRAP